MLKKILAVFGTVIFMLAAASAASAAGTLQSGINFEVPVELIDNYYIQMFPDSPDESKLDLNDAEDFAVFNDIHSKKSVISDGFYRAGAEPYEIITEYFGYETYLTSDFWGYEGDDIGEASKIVQNHFWG